MIAKDEYTKFNECVNKSLYNPLSTDRTATYFSSRFKEYTEVLNKYNISFDCLVSYLKSTSIPEDVIDNYILTDKNPNRRIAIKIAAALNLTSVYFITPNGVVYKNYLKELEAKLKAGATFSDLVGKSNPIEKSINEPSSKDDTLTSEINQLVDLYKNSTVETRNRVLDIMRESLKNK